MTDLIEKANRRHNRNYSLVSHGGGKYSLKAQGSYLLKNQTQEKIISFLQERLK